jgi:hypothetical protein
MSWIKARMPFACASISRSTWRSESPKDGVGPILFKRLQQSLGNSHTRFDGRIEQRSHKSVLLGMGRSVAQCHGKSKLFDQCLIEIG